jgi:UDP-N-acetylglucosamine transferase subunit ALG13
LKASYQLLKPSILALKVAHKATGIEKSSEEPTMKKTALLIAVLTLTATGAFADEITAKNPELTLAAAELNTKNAWVDTEEDVQLRLEEDLSEKTDALNAKVNSKLEKQLADKLARDLNI